MARSNPPSNPPSNAKALVVTLRLFRLVPFLTGVADLLGGTWILQQAGAAIPRGASLDPVLNNQIAFWGCNLARLRRGLVVDQRRSTYPRLSRTHSAGDAVPERPRTRGYSLLLYRFPGPVLAGAMAVELGLPPILFLWLNRLAQTR